MLTAFLDTCALFPSPAMALDTFLDRLATHAPTLVTRLAEEGL